MGRHKKNSVRVIKKTKNIFSFQDHCDIIKEHFDAMFSEEVLHETDAKEASLFLEKLSEEIKLQLEIVQHRVIIQELRGKSLLTTPPTAQSVKKSRKPREKSVVSSIKRKDSKSAASSSGKRGRGRPRKDQESVGTSGELA